MVFSFPATANQQPTAGPTDTGGQPNPTGPASITSRPVQKEQGTVGNGHTSTGAERARQEETGVLHGNAAVGLLPPPPPPPPHPMCNSSSPLSYCD